MELENREVAADDEVDEVVGTGAEEESPEEPQE